MGVWYGGSFLEALLLFRGLKSRLLGKYPLFYSYIAAVLIGDTLRFISYRWQPSFYSEVYWTTQFIELALGAAVMFEIYRVGLASFPGTARMTRNVLYLVFALLLAKSIGSASNGGFTAWRVAHGPIDFERDLRIIQAFCLIALVVIFLLYAIPVDRNLKGILAGYGLFVAAGVIELSLVSRLWLAMEHIWTYTQPLCYVAVVSIWVYALWSYEPAKACITQPQPEADYDLVTHTTRRRFQKAFAGLLKAVRP